MSGPEHSHGPRAAMSERLACARCRVDSRFGKEMRQIHRSKSESTVVVETTTLKRILREAK